MNSTQRAYWICQIGGWGTFYLFQFAVAWQLFRMPPLQLLSNVCIQFMLFVTATHLLHSYIKKHRWINLVPRILLRRSVFASAAIALLVVAVGFSLTAYLQSRGFDLRPPTKASFAVTLASSLVNSFVIVSIWLTIYFGVVVLRQRQHLGSEEVRLRAALRTAELSLLKSQLNPHFLFNALNTVRALINESPQRAEVAVTQLARTLRYSLNSSRDELVTLANELDIVKDYLGIETLRLAERLTIVYEISPASLTSHIPIMLLQTLVENAVKHGISQLPQGGTLCIATRLENTVLILEVKNDRPLIKNTDIPSDRVGLANANERLRLMVGPSATLALDLSSPQTAQATVRIPQVTAQSPVGNR